jgi:hypothetical protein
MTAVTTVLPFMLGSNGLDVTKFASRVSPRALYRLITGHSEM